MMNVDKILCKRQGQLFEYVFDKGYDAAAFSDMFLSSDFCAVFFDTEYSHYQMALPPEILRAYCDFEKRPAPMKTSNNILDGNAFFWIGYTYRNLYLETGIMSRDLIRFIPLNEMAKLYPVYHTLNPRICVDNIMEAYGIRKEKTNLRAL